MQLLIKQLPPEVCGGDTILRHWMVFDDGRIFYQDETLQYEGKVKSLRTIWVQLPTPPSTAQVAGTFEYGGLPGAILTDGKAYLWATVPPKDEQEEFALQALSHSHRIHEWPHAWQQFHEPVPGTIAYSEYNR